MRRRYQTFILPDLPYPFNLPKASRDYWVW